METRGLSATHRNDGKALTEREKKRRAGFLAHVARQQALQTGGSSKFNIAVDDGGAEVIVLLEHVDD
jgi:hypothetical protein